MRKILLLCCMSILCCPLIYGQSVAKVFASPSPNAGLAPLNADTTNGCTPDLQAICIGSQAPSVHNNGDLGCSKNTRENRVRQTYFVGCINPLTLNLIPNCRVDMTLKVVPFSGSHLHGDPGRDPGQLCKPPANSPTCTGTTLSVMTGSTGALVPFLFESPETAGTALLTLSGVSPQGFVSPSNVAIGVAAQDPRVELPASGFKFQMNENSTGHAGANQWATPQASLEFQSLPVVFAQAEVDAGTSLDEVPDLVFTSIGLPSGGLFDVDTTGSGHIDNPWHPPHCAHRDGIEMDIRINNLDDVQRSHLDDAVTDTCIGVVVRRNVPHPSQCLFFSYAKESPNPPPGVNPTHWHVKAR